MPTLTSLAAIPFTVTFLFAPDPFWAFVFYAPHWILGAMYAGPIYAMTQAVVKLRLRSLRCVRRDILGRDADF